jgi:hypothetical protein
LTDSERTDRRFAFGIGIARISKLERNCDCMKQNRLYAGMAVFAALLVVLGLSVLPFKKQPRANHRSPISSLGYCSAANLRPCIVSFSLNPNGKMLVNILTSETPLPKFYLKITHSKGESRYACKPAKGYVTTIYCTGEAMHPGETLQFVIASIKGNTVLAEGSFSIVGLAYATPEDASTPTASPAPSSDQITGTPGTPHPTPTLLPGTHPIGTSYPNPYP